MLAIGNTAYEKALAEAGRAIRVGPTSIPLVEQYRGQVRVVRRGDIKTRFTSGHPKSSGEIELVCNANGNADELTALFREITKEKKITVRPEISVLL
ncbi:hypothetical protein ACFT8P_33955 [Streptomyces sp. NPDC057101]|uniref:hypothetical protein n=1 Tax=Streptomyces sp. NPDC057101 TaxID=3346020 RepID=UPI00363C7D0A